ncbi:formylmethanofuran dehydrogenase [Methanoculleus taiwanensis]|uniref:Formylmethanofuran dehydrogenase n=2 Tax=Methanoculleus taiwanensis TaxID=1550565 RepID=A0A498H1Q6_9EURY|nr:formylmethanofuran dehydrogenase [Methanoculleus taiwanensis]
MEENGLSPDLRDDFRRSIAFHTYPAPGLLIGVFMVDYALELLSATRGEKLYAVSETPKCLPDPLQVIAYCTAGNHRLRILPIGKFAITVNWPSDGPEAEGVRVFLDEEKMKRYPVFDLWYAHDPAFDKKSMGGKLLDEIFEAQRDVLSYERVRIDVTAKQPWKSERCSVCGEMIPDFMLLDGVCFTCSDRSYFTVLAE